MSDNKASNRQKKMHHWLKQQLATSYEYTTASADASFRRYFRVKLHDRTLILMDAPPEHEDVRPFLHTARLFREAGLNIPEIIAANHEEGFLLLTDFGNTLYLDALNDDSADNLYGQAINSLIKLQQFSLDKGYELPPYSEPLLLEEMQLFEHWFLNKWLEIPSTGHVQGQLHSVYFRLLDNILNQAKVWVHRDFHSRNLMVTEKDCPGILDFQDAVCGPVTYDLASLLRDSYIQWPTHRVHDWSQAFFKNIRDLGIISPDISSAQWQQDLYWMSAQRHLKVLGIFCRLYLRDEKENYLQYLPRTFRYLIQCLDPYPEFSGFVRWLQENVEPVMFNRMQSSC